jgi:hypothetical protein
VRRYVKECLFLERSADELNSERKLADGRARERDRGKSRERGERAEKVVLRVRELVKRGIDTVAFATCIQKGAPIGYPCPFAAKMRALVEKEVGENIRILDHTH